MKEIWAVAGQKFKELGKQARECEKTNTWGGGGGCFHFGCVCVYVIFLALWSLSQSVSFFENPAD